MIRLMFGLAMATLVMARPELYREKEDFQYSRSSSDEGRKSGYYDAQRGNMGGNYEKAHNMDTQAQHQMGGLVRQVEGELGDASNMRTGSVFSSANSRGVYGSGHYDLSNLAGRNFQEGTSYGDSQLSSMANSAYTAKSSTHNNARYSTSGHSLNSGYRGYQSSNLQEAQNLYGASKFEQDAQVGQSSRVHSQSGYEGQNFYTQQENADQFAAQNIDANIANTHRHRLISTVPVKIIVRPGQSIAVPTATQTHSGSQIASYYDENAVNSDAEVLGTNVHQQTLKPSNNAKHYESSYSYRKEWEKHNTRPAVIPLAVPTVTPISKNSELYDDSVLRRGTQFSGDRYEQNADFNAASSQSRHQTDYNEQRLSSGLANSNSNAFSQSGADSKFDSQSTNLIGTLSTKPKSYQSSYSYHKSWERQGDPYIIKPASNGVYETQTADRLTDASTSQAAYSYISGSKHQNQQRYTLNNNCLLECEPSHNRVARSYNSEPYQFEQKSQNYENSQESQQTQESLAQIEVFGQQTQTKDNLEDLGQQTQNQWDNLADLSQQTQQHWTETNGFGQQSLKKENLEDLGQQTQNQWDNLAELGQQTQQQWAQVDGFGQQMKNTEGIGQQTQNQWDSLTELGGTGQANSFGQQTQTFEDFGHQIQEPISQRGSQLTQNKWDNSENLEQNTQNTFEKLDLGQQTQTKVEEFGKFPMDNGKHKEDVRKEHNDTNKSRNLKEFPQHPVSKPEPTNTREMAKPFWNNPSDNENSQKSDNNQESMQLNTQTDTTQSISRIWSIVPNQDKSIYRNSEVQEYSKDFYSKPDQDQSSSRGSLSNLWGKLGNLDDEYSQYAKNNEQNHFSQSSSSQDFEQNWHHEGTYHHTLSESDFTKKEINDNDTQQEKSTEKSIILSVVPQTEVHDIKYTTPKAEKPTLHHQVNIFYNNDEQTTSTYNIRPIDVSRGDIGPEDSFIDAALIETSYSNKEKTENNTNNTEADRPSQSEPMSEEVTHNLRLGSSNLEKGTPFVRSFKNEEEATTEFVRYQNMPQELEPINSFGNFEQNKDYLQSNQGFIDTMKNVESQNSYQQNFEELSISSQQNKELNKHINWNTDSQNTEQQFINNFSQQDVTPVLNFDQSFVDFGQQHEAMTFQGQQVHKNISPTDFIPENINLDAGNAGIIGYNEEKAGHSHDFDQSFVDFGQQHETMTFQGQQVHKNISPTDFIPDNINLDAGNAGIIGYNEEKAGHSHDLKLPEKQNQESVVQKTKVSHDLSTPEDKQPYIKSKSMEYISDSVTETPGFWRSVGNKLSNVKSKVASWFGS